MAGAVGGQVRRWAPARGMDAGIGEDMRRDTAESKREVRELGRDSPGALLPAEQGKEGSPQQKCREVAAWISF